MSLIDINIYLLFDSNQLRYFNTYMFCSTECSDFDQFFFLSFFFLKKQNNIFFLSISVVLIAFAKAYFLIIRLFALHSVDELRSEQNKHKTFSWIFAFSLNIISFQPKIV